jgi:hypothetical protein
MCDAVASDTFRISITFQLLPCSTEQLRHAVRYGGMDLMATEVACDEGSPTSTFRSAGFRSASAYCSAGSQRHE